MKKVLVIDESSLFRQYLKEKLEGYGFQVILGINGLDGMAKLRSEIPDLVIMDYYLSRRASLELLREKAANANISGIPVIMASVSIDKKQLLEVASLNVRKFFTKPIRIDALLKTVAEELGTHMEMDSSPCIIEAHFNEEILFIEVARGLNREKVDLLRYKIKELLELYQRKNPKVLIIMSDVNLSDADTGKLHSFLQAILETTRSPQRYIKLLTNSDFIRDYISGHEELAKIEVTDNLSKAMDGLLGIKVSYFRSEGKTIMKQDLLTAQDQEAMKEESIQMRFDAQAAESPSQDRTIAVVDDDFVIVELVKAALADFGWEVRTFEDGQAFVEALPSTSFDLVFLDLLMPRMSGFEVLQFLQAKKLELPVIVLSALSQKETVVKARSGGAKSYLIKPLKPETIQRKAAEVLKANF